MTPSDVPYFFVSYSSGDRNIVYHVAHRIAERNIALWMDTENLQPGMNWYEEIKRGIQNAYGLIVFLSSTRIESEDSRSVVDTMFHEMALADERIVSVYLNSSAEIPWDLAEAKFVDLSDPARFEEGIEHLIEILETMLLESESTGKGIGLGAKDLEEYAQKTEQQIRRTARKELSSTPKSVFIVHGHDIGLRDEVEKYLSGQGVEAVVLSKMDNSHDSLFKKFLAWSGETRFAVVLITADDIGSGRYQYDEPGVGERSLQFRARQNVILELGFFYGFLGWENVFVLFKKPDKVYPNFERPSDLDGILFEEVNNTHDWKEYLRQRLLEAGFQLKQ